MDEDVIEGSIAVDVVGESFYRDALLVVAARGSDHIATLVPDPDNPYDPQAVKVMILDRQVGHLSRENAALLCSRLTARTEISGPCRVRAKVGGGGAGQFGVKLWLPLPDQL